MDVAQVRMIGTAARSGGHGQDVCAPAAARAGGAAGPQEHIARAVAGAGPAQAPADVETVVHALLRLVADEPGMFGRVRAGRTLCGRPSAAGEERDPAWLEPYAVAVGWRLTDVVALVDRLLEGGLLARTPGSRPTLVLTRAGHRALDALEG